MKTNTKKQFPQKRKQGSLSSEQLYVSKNKITIMTIFTSIVLLFILLVGTVHAQNPKTYIPPRAFELRDTLYDEIIDMIPMIPDYNYVPSLIEHESCISLTHSRCWSANSILDNKREYSVGFFQIAKAYNKDGSIRMDTLAGLKRRYKTRLAELDWNNIAQRPDLQIRAGIALIHDNWQYFNMITDPWERLAFTDAGYNGGPGNVAKERRQCGLTTGCDPQKWFGNVERICVRNKTPIAAYGGRSICDISRAHPQDVIKYRLPKYQDQYFNEEYVKSRKTEI